MKASGSINGNAMYALLLWLMPLLTAASVNDAGPENDTLPVILKHPLVAGTERVSLITDRGTYIAGENVWFTIMVEAAGNKKIPRSLAAYTEILNPSGLPVAQSRVLTDSNGAGNGVLTLPDSLSSGDYILRGYTRAMTSMGPEYFYTRIIRVFNPYNVGSTYAEVLPGSASHGPVSEGPSVKIFPEGGSFIPGRPVRVVIRTADTSGRGIPAMVIISPGDPADGSGNLISGSWERTGEDTIFTDVNGLASCVVIPSEKLLAETVVDSILVRTHLAGKLSGRHAISLTPGKEGNVVATVSHENEAGSGEWLHLAVIGNRGLTFFRKFRSAGAEEHFELPAGIHGKGISECLLYDSNGNLVASRLFMNGRQETPVGDEGKLTLNVTGKTLKATIPAGVRHITLSAALSGESQPLFPGNHILLGGWLKAGVMADPFLEPFISGKEDLSDELLMTLRDRYLDINAEILNSVVAETQGIAVDCSVAGLEGRTAAPGKRLFINLPGTECFLRYAISNDEGRATFFVPPHAGTREIVIYPEDTTANISIRTLAPWFGGSAAFQTSKRDIMSVADRTVMRMSMNSQVMRIYQVSHTDTAEVKPDTTVGMHFYGTPGQRLKMADYIALPEMEEFFFELISGFTLVKTRAAYEFRVYDPVTGEEIKSTPLMFIDGTVTTDPGTIARLSPYITRYIDIRTRKFRLGEVLLPPLVSVITNNGDFRGQSLPPGAMRISYRFSDPVIYFRPFAGDVSQHMPRFPNTVMWNSWPVAAGQREIEITIPGHDYSAPVTISVYAFGDDGTCYITSMAINRDGNQ